MTREEQHSTQSLPAAFVHAASGISRAARERNFNIECVIALIALVLGAILHISAIEWLVVVLCIMVVLALECVNTAIEALTDLASPDIHPLAKTAKDCAAGAVLLASIGSVVCAGIIFVPPFLELIGVTPWT